MRVIIDAEEMHSLIEPATETTTLISGYKKISCCSLHKAARVAERAFTLIGAAVLIGGSFTVFFHSILPSETVAPVVLTLLIGAPTAGSCYVLSHIIRKSSSNGPQPEALI